SRRQCLAIRRSPPQLGALATTRPLDQAWQLQYSNSSSRFKCRTAAVVVGLIYTALQVLHLRHSRRLQTVITRPFRLSLVMALSVSVGPRQEEDCEIAGNIRLAKIAAELRRVCMFGNLRSHLPQIIERRQEEPQAPAAVNVKVAHAANVHFRNRAPGLIISGIGDSGTGVMGEIHAQ